MSDAARLEALERVAAAARDWRHAKTAQAAQRGFTNLVAALNALNALPPAPQPAGEVVEVRGCVGVDGNSYYAYGANGEPDDELQDAVTSAGYEPLCMFTVQVPAKAPLPTIPATVEQEPAR